MNAFEPTILGILNLSLNFLLRIEQGQISFDYKQPLTFGSLIAYG